jgi:hypothetical protein
MPLIGYITHLCMYTLRMFVAGEEISIFTSLRNTLREHKISPNHMWLVGKHSSCQVELLKDTQVTCIDPGKTINGLPRKETADGRIMCDMFIMALDNPGCTFVLITGDSDFGYALSHLSARGYQIVLISQGSAPERLKIHAHKLINWFDILHPRDPEVIDDGKRQSKRSNLHRSSFQQPVLTRMQQPAREKNNHAIDPVLLVNLMLPLSISESNVFLF